MASPPTAKPTRGGFFDSIFRRSRRQYSDEGSSRRGRRFFDRGEDYSVGKDSSTHSALFDLELSTRGHPRSLIDDRIGMASSSTQGSAGLHAKLQRIAYLAFPSADFEVELYNHVEGLREACSQSDGGIDLLVMAQELSKFGYLCSLQYNDPAAYARSQQQQQQQQAGGSQAPPVAIDPSSLEKLKHCFIVCSGRSSQGNKKTASISHYCMVDPQFKDQFQIGQPNELYRSIIAVLPNVFVGSPLRFQALADILCTEIVAVYKEQQLPLPPWRKPAAIMSKWFDLSTRMQTPAAGPMLPSIQVAVTPVANTSTGNSNIVQGDRDQSIQQRERNTTNDAINASDGESSRSGRASLGFHRDNQQHNDLATIQEGPSTHAVVIPKPSSTHQFGEGSSDVFYPDSVGGNSASGSGSESGRSVQRSSGKVVSLLARGLNSLKLRKMHDTNPAQQR